jgi:EmrB/QacA subfamily drug resistance transporter
MQSDPRLSIDDRRRQWIIIAALIALFLGALDALIMSAAMPTIVADLGGLHLYSWVYSAYFLSRAVSLPLFGKLADLYQTRTLLFFSIGLFLLASIMAALSTSMGFLVFARVLQGIGAGGNFALVYIVLSDVSSAEERGKTLAWASFIWGIASVTGPTLGGFIVSYFSWRWIFWINLPVGLISLTGIGLYLVEMREKKRHVHLDWAGVATLTLSIMGLLTIFIMGGRTYPWLSLPMAGLTVISVLSLLGFLWAEKHAKDPLISLEFFTVRGFRTGNGAVFLSSFAIFGLFAYAPLYIQGGLGKSPLEVGWAMLTLSLGWSLGSLIAGRSINQLGKKRSTLLGAVCLTAGTGMTVFFSTDTAIAYCLSVFTLVGIGMGFISLSTLLVVQDSLSDADLGVATSSHQFARTLGGTVGVGACGGLVTTRLTTALSATDLPAGLMDQILQNLESIFKPQFQAQIPAGARAVISTAVTNGVSMVFWMVLVVAVCCAFVCWRIPAEGPSRHEP